MSIASSAEAAIGESAEKARAAVADAVDTATRTGRKAARDAEEVMGNLDEAVRDFVREKPYTALAVAGFAGFLYAVIRRP
jgi:ElaB/YqjD/DUF883 family membrane-anchored ribosome-binding protein